MNILGEVVRRNWYGYILRESSAYTLCVRGCMENECIMHAADGYVRSFQGNSKPHCQS